MRIVMLAYGSWGDVRPYVVLGQALQNEGFDVIVMAAEEFRDWVVTHDLEFVGLPLNVQKIMDTMMKSAKDEDTGTNFIQTALHFRKIMSSAMMQLGEKVAEVVREGDALLYVEVVESLVHGIVAQYRLRPIIVSLFPMTPSAQFPIFNLPESPAWLPARGWYNRMSGSMLRWVTWQMIGRQGNKIRTEQLGLPPIGWRQHRRLLQSTPHLLLVSSHVLPPPPDWSPQIQVTGYIFDDDPTWQPPQDLLDFLEGGEKPIYIGFGSMAEKDPEATTRLMIHALQEAGKRAILLSGWAGIGGIDLPDTVFRLNYAPHSWLFPRMAAVMHHGGAGTTAAGLRAGVPTIIVPTLGDQAFWGRQIYELGAGTKPLKRSKLTVSTLAGAFREATENQHIRERARELSHSIQQEDGLNTAVMSIKKLLASPVPA